MKKAKPMFEWELYAGDILLRATNAYTKSEARAKFKNESGFKERLPNRYSVEKVVHKKEGAK